MAGMTAQQLAEKWGNNTVAARPSYEAGIKAVTQSPGQAAAAKADHWAAQVAQAKQAFIDGANGVSLQAWQQATLQKGSANMATGVAAAKAKVAAHLAAFKPYIDAAAAAAKAAHPGDDVESGILRAAAVIRAAKEFAKQNR